MSAECGARSAESGRSTVLICFAMEDEARAFRKLASGRTGVQILVTGIGRRNAERSLSRVLAQGLPHCVFTCGFAGGLDPALKAGDVVCETDDAALRDKHFASRAKPAKFFCADRIATTAAEKQRLRADTGADAVEMESAAIQAVCRERGIPCATVRVISDSAHEDLPLDFNQLANADQSLNYGKLAWAIMKSPRKIFALRRLQKNTRLAAENLATVLGKAV